MAVKLNKHFFLVGTMLLSTLFAFFIIDLFSKNQGSLDDAIHTETALKKEIIQLESRLIEFQDTYYIKDQQLELTETLLEEKYTELDVMTQKAQKLEKAIVQLEAKGTADKRSILEMKAQLADVKNNLIASYKSDISDLVVDLTYMIQHEDSLKSENELISQKLQQSQKNYQDCLNGKTVTAPPTGIEPDPALAQRIGFYTENVRVLCYNKSGALVGARRNIIDSKKIDRLNVSFDFDAGSPPPGVNSLIGIQKLYFHMHHAKAGTTIVNPAQSQSGETFMFEGKKLSSTFSAIANYQGNRLRVEAEYVIGESLQEVPKGNYLISIYRQDNQGESELIGSHTIFFQ